jgi:hypothetical protein
MCFFEGREGCVEVLFAWRDRLGGRHGRHAVLDEVREKQHEVVDSLSDHLRIIIAFAVRGTMFTTAASTLREWQVWTALHSRRYTNTGTAFMIHPYCCSNRVPLPRSFLRHCVISPEFPILRNGKEGRVPQSTDRLKDLGEVVLTNVGPSFTIFTAGTRPGLGPDVQAPRIAHFRWIGPGPWS